MTTKAVRRRLAPTAITAGLLVAACAAALLPATDALAAKGGGHKAAQTINGDACTALETPTRQADPVLGGGVTVSTGRDGNLFPAGATPALSVTAGPDSAGQTLHVTVRDRSRVVAAQDTALPDPSAVSLPNRPGWFKVLLERRLGASVLGSSCLWYGVSAGRAALDLGVLPTGSDWGGPSVARDVALHAQLGVPVVRRQINVADFLAHPVGDPSLAAGAASAHALGLRFVVQIGQGGAAETAAVAAGTWGALVRQIVAANPTVPYWEAWNEPNVSPFFTGTPRDYVTKVLAPFAASVRAAAPSALVVGGTALSDDEWWWGQFARLGGFKLVDVIGVHPYTYGWDAPESGGLTAVLSAVRRLADRSGGRRKPIFDTESGWPSAWAGTGSSLWTQADYVSRKLVLERTLGVLSSQFEIEGGWQDWGVIDVVRGVKPAAMSLSTTSSVLAGRRFLGWWKTGARGVMAARFAGGRGVTVLWATGASRVVSLRCGVSGVDAYGASVRAARSIVAGSSPVFLNGASAKRAGCLKGSRSSHA
jgi:hypothetical protein